jgi:hypothetical protein
VISSEAQARGASAASFAERPLRVGIVGLSASGVGPRWPTCQPCARSTAMTYALSAMACDCNQNCNQSAAPSTRGGPH